MAADYFLIDAPCVVPTEFAAWQAAKELHRSIFSQALFAAGTDQEEALNLAGQEARKVADRLEQIARQAWYQAGRKCEHKVAKHEPQYCTYPKCRCPFDAPADPNWCARGLPHKKN